MNNVNEQSVVTKKKFTNAFSVNRKLVNSKIFRDKFELLPLSLEAKQIVYNEVCKLLEYVDGQENEYLMALDFYDGHRIVDNFNREATAKGTGFTEMEYKLIENDGADIITVHNHSYNGKPSARDMITFFSDDKIRLSIIACHNGDLYAIFNVSEVMISLYDEILELEEKIVGKGDLAKSLATTKLYKMNEEIKSKKKKLFDVRRL